MVLGAIEVQPNRFVNWNKVRSIGFVDIEDRREVVVDYDNPEKMVNFGEITVEWERELTATLRGRKRKDAGF